MHELIEARDDERQLRPRAQLAKVTLLITDERGFARLSKPGEELLFESFGHCYERGSILVPSILLVEE